MADKTVELKFSDEIDDATIDEIKSTMEYWILDEHYDIQVKDGVFVPRYLCDWCDDDITKDEEANQEGKCKECYAEWSADEEEDSEDYYD